MNDYHILSGICKFCVQTVKGIPSGDVNVSVNKGVLTITWFAKTNPISVKVKLSTIKKYAFRTIGLDEPVQKTSKTKQRRYKSC